MAYNTSQIDSSLTIDDVGYLSLLKHGELDVDKNENDYRFTRMELSDISHLNNAMTIFQNDTIKRRLRYMITSNDASKTIENVISINNKRSSSFPNIFKKVTYYMMQDMIHSVIFSSSVLSLSSKSSSSSSSSLQLQSQYSSSDSSSINRNNNHNSSINTIYNNIYNNNYKLFLNLSKHTSRVSARDIYADNNNNSNNNNNNEDDDNNNNTDGNLSEYFLFGFSPESELLKNLIAVINVTASLFISSINVLEYDIRKRHDTICQAGREMEYAHMLRDVKQLKSVSAATYNFIRNATILCKKATVCSCCGSKSHTQSPLVDKSRKLYNNNVNINSNNIAINKKKETNILIPPEMIFKGTKNVKKTSISPSSSTSSSVKLQIGMKKSNGRVRTAIDKQIKSALSNMRDIKYRQMYNPIATPTSISTTLTEVKQQRSSETTTTTTSSFSHNPLPSSSSSSSSSSHNKYSEGKPKEQSYDYHHQKTSVSSLEPPKVRDDNDSDKNNICSDANDSSTAKYLDMRDCQQKREIVNYVKYH